jgi:hypothetical protein
MARQTNNLSTIHWIRPHQQTCDLILWLGGSYPAPHIHRQERTATTFVDVHRDMVNDGSYFRFNVDSGLEDIDLDSKNALEKVQTATLTYLRSSFISDRTAECAKRLSQTASQPSQDTGLSLPGGDESEVPPIHDHAPPIPNVPGGETKEQRDDVSKQGVHEGPENRPERQPIVPGESQEGVAMINIVANHILQDFELQSLLVSATSKIGKERMAKNLNILLKNFAQQLRQVDNAHDLAVFVSNDTLHHDGLGHTHFYRLDEPRLFRDRGARAGGYPGPPKNRRSAATNI